MQIIGFSPFGYEGALVTVEVDLRRGIPAVDLVGLADNAVKEARERMRAAIRNSGFDFPPERVLISLSPADVKKEGSAFDLAIALAVLAASDEGASPAGASFPSEAFDAEKPVLVMGELELSGRVRPVRGVHCAVSAALEQGIRHCILPEENAMEAGIFTDMKISVVRNLSEARHEYMRMAAECVCPEDPGVSSGEQKGNRKKSLLFPRDTSVEFAPVIEEEDFAFVTGQKKLVRALQVAAAGGHNCMVFGPPGCGKTLAIQRFSSLLPLLSGKDAAEVTRIYSIAGLLPPDVQLIRKPPFRIPHQGASLEGMAGGGIGCRPGEISLAHNGVLFLDEAAEFRTAVLQSLRVPLETGCIKLSRAGRHTVFPAQFQLLLATNPCPCGNFGSPDKICVCSIKSVEQYWKKFSAPLLDRIDIRCPVIGNSVSLVKSRDDIDKSDTVSSEELRKDIGRAVNIQLSRQGKKNSRLSPEEIQYYCKLTPECSAFLTEVVSKKDFSARAVHSCIKVARTIADMAGSFNIRQEDLEEAVELRKTEGSLDICFASL
ncbi:MAG: YifB family Mg chelatase-like AAA ATPase [Treponemataceae bacterium]|nr:YifB family Mg chelatase-like AAA ATPase [Treponemataceae bacterium]